MKKVILKSENSAPTIELNDVSAYNIVVLRLYGTPNIYLQIPCGNGVAFSNGHSTYARATDTASLIEGAIDRGHTVMVFDNMSQLATWLATNV